MIRFQEIDNGAHSTKKKILGIIFKSGPDVCHDIGRQQEQPEVKILKKYRPTTVTERERERVGKVANTLNTAWAHIRRQSFNC